MAFQHSTSEDEDDDDQQQYDNEPEHQDVSFAHTPSSFWYFFQYSLSHYTAPSIYLYHNDQLTFYLVGDFLMVFLTILGTCWAPDAHGAESLSDEATVLRRYLADTSAAH